MSDVIEDVLRLVAEGRLTPDEAAPLIGALTGATGAGRRPARNAGASRPSDGDGDRRPLRIRLQVRDNGRAVVDMEVPGVLADLAAALPGIPMAYAERVREAIRNGLRGPVIDVRDEDGGGISITIE